MTQYQLSPFEVGQVKAHVEHGLSAAKIAERMVKADGQSTFHANAIQNCINKLGQQPEWRGGREPGSGRPRKTTAKQDNQIVKWVLKEEARSNFREMGLHRWHNIINLRIKSSTSSLDAMRAFDHLLVEGGRRPSHTTGL